jgi:hypothetical protein
MLCQSPNVVIDECDTLSAEVMTGTAFEADELYQHEGEKVCRIAT